MILAYALKCFKESANQPRMITTCPPLSLEDPAACFTQRRTNRSLERKHENRSKTDVLIEDAIDDIDIDNDNFDSEDDARDKRRAKQGHDVYRRSRIRGCSSRLNLGKISKTL